MSRLAVLNSDYSGYLQSLRELSLLYIGRGYPPALVNQWQKVNITKRWNSRFLQRDQEGESSGVWALKTKFNDTWNSINIKNLQTLIYDQWKKDLFGPKGTTLGKRKRNENAEDSRKKGTGQGAGAYNTTVRRSNSPERVPASDYTVVVGGRTNQSTPFSDPHAEVKAPKSVQWPIVFTGKRLLVSRSRHLNLWDLTRIWNKSILNSLEDTVLSPNPSGSGSTPRAPSYSPGPLASTSQLEEVQDTTDQPENTLPDPVPSTSMLEDEIPGSSTILQAEITQELDFHSRLREVSNKRKAEHLKEATAYAEREAKRLKKNATTDTPYNVWLDPGRM